MTPDQHWRADAACKDMGPRAFFPPNGPHRRWTETTWTPEAAFKVCARCPVRQDCLDDAIATGEKEGVRGGVLLSSEPHRLRRLSTASHGTRTRYRAGCRCQECTEASRVNKARLQGRQEAS